MARFSGLCIAVVSLMSLAGCAELGENEANTEGLSKTRLSSLLNEMYPFSLQAKQGRIAEARKRTKSLKSSKLSQELLANISIVEKELEEEIDRLQGIELARIESGTEEHLASLSNLKGTPRVNEVPFKGVIRGNATLRGEPSRDSLDVARVPSGTEITILEGQGDWFLIKIRVPFIQGYVFGDFVEVNGPVEETEVAIERNAKLARAEPATLLAPKPTLLDELFDSVDLAANGPISPIAPLSNGVDNLADRIEKERVEFKSPAFRCRGELDICRRNNFGYLDCELTMIMCLADVILP